MTILDINRDDHRLVLVRLQTKNIKPKVIWQDQGIYCVDFPNYEDYSKAKAIQVQLEHQTGRRMPHI